MALGSEETFFDRSEMFAPEPVAIGSRVPLLSICIPTFNRLQVLKRSIDFHLEAFRRLGFPFEIVIVDDHSTDGTAEYLVSLNDVPELSLHHRHQNAGFLNNYAFAMRRAKGDFVLFLGDDDLLIPENVSSYVARMASDPSLGMLQAPWMLVDARPNGGDMGPFYQVPEEFRFDKGQFKELGNFILHFHVFPEFMIIRRDVLCRAISSECPFIFWAFLFTARALAHSDILFVPAPFARVTAITDDPRLQQGNTETMFKWDHYLGGIEYIVALGSRGSLTPPEERFATLQAINRFMAIRKKVALRLLVQARKWTEAYIMIHRIAAYEPLPVTRQQLVEISTLAGLSVAAHEASDFSPAEVMIGPGFDESIQNALGHKDYQLLLQPKNGLDHDLPRAYLKTDPALPAPVDAHAVFDIREYVAQFV